MAKDTSFTIKVCDLITKYSIYILVFLLPVLFLPWTSEVLDFNKQALLVGLVFVSLFSWMLKVLVSGKFEANVNKAHIFVGALFLVYLLATIFSVDKYGSFWGWPKVTAEGFLTLIGLVVLYLIVSNAFSKKEIVKSLYVFSASVLVVQIYGILQLFGLFIIPAGFAKNISFNTVGGAGGLGIFSAVLLPLMIVLLIIAKKWWKILFALVILSSALILVLLNYPIVWWVVVAGSALIMVFGVFKRNLFDGRWMALPMFFLAISLFFVILNPQINILPQKTNEISLSQQANFQVDMQALKERPILGSGPGTFAYDFLKFKNADFSKTVLWNVSLNSGNSKVLTVLATTGILGILGLFALMGAIIFYAGRHLVAQKNDSNSEVFYLVLGLGLFVSFVSQIIAYFLHNSSLTLDFVFFFVIAILVGFVFDKRKEYELKPSSLLTLIVTFTFTLVFIFGLGLLILGGQRYIAEVNYYGGLSALQNNNLDEGIKGLEKAVLLNSGSDLYFSQLSQVYLVKIQEVAANKEMSNDDKTKNIQALVANSVNASKIATDINPQSSGNWLTRGYVYQSLNGLVTDSQTWAINSYNEALKLDPNNPYSLTQLGVVYYQNKDFQNAKTNFDKALELKPDYSNALYLSGLTLDQLGQKSKAIEQFTILQQLNPDSKADIQKVINNLKAGNGALDGLTQQAPIPEAPSEATTPSQETNPPATKK
ncbi:MAG: tetratricopeptide repeat protein [Candidatus Pacebacteria bacterium]|jgi:tetratricopeptide (TPR) repeat protein/O-antigen ligase|nr:tetratricopeptide repeat protein [Candidatus Paceibacterota bacterium]